MTGLSNAPLNLSTTVQAIGAGSQLPSGLNASIEGDNLSYFTNQASASGAATLYYPLDTPKYIMTFTISQYDRTSLNTIGTFQAAPGYPGIVLPLPENMLDSDQVIWQEVEAGMFTGAFINAAIAGNVPGMIAAGGAAAGAAVLSKVGVNVQESLALGGSLIGVAPNQFVTMLMRGPRYKRHHFNWNLAPHNYGEAQQLQQIITVFRNAMAPGQGFSLGGNAPALWTYPKVFYIRLYPNSGFMYKFKPAIINALTVNYTPASKAAFLRDGSGPNADSGNNPPAVVQMQMELIEIEFWTEGNYENSNNPDQSVTYGSNTQLTETQTAAVNAFNNAVNAVESGTQTIINQTQQFFGSK